MFKWKTLKTRSLEFKNCLQELEQKHQFITSGNMGEESWYTPLCTLGSQNSSAAVKVIPAYQVQFHAPVCDARQEP